MDRKSKRFLDKGWELKDVKEYEVVLVCPKTFEFDGKIASLAYVKPKKSKGLMSFYDRTNDCLLYDIMADYDLKLD